MNLSMKDILIDIKLTNMRNIEKRIRAERLSNISKMINVWKKQNNGYQFVYDGKFALPIYLSDDMHTITMDFKSIDNWNINVEFIPKGHTEILERKVTEYSDDSSRAIFIQLFNSFVYKDIEEYDKYIFIKVYLKAKIKYDAIGFSYEFSIPITDDEVKYLSFVDHPNSTYVTRIFHCTYKDGILRL